MREGDETVDCDATARDLVVDAHSSGQPFFEKLDVPQGALWLDKASYGKL